MSSQRQPSRLGVIASLLVALVAVVGTTVALMMFATGHLSGNGSSSEWAPAQVEEAETPLRIDTERRDPDDPTAIGDVDAPVALVMFSDFQCPYCAAWTQQTLPELMPYVEDGDLRIEWRDLDVFGPDSLRGAIAAHAAGEQGEYLAFHEELFADGSAASSGRLSEEGLVDLADSLGLDPAPIREALAESSAPAIEENIAEAAELGIYATPAFFIAGRPVIGAQPTDVFVDLIDEELAAAGPLERPSAG